MADSLINSGGAKLNLSELVFYFIIEYYTVHILELQFVGYISATRYFLILYCTFIFVTISQYNYGILLLKNESERAKIVLKDGYPLDLDFYPQLKKLIMISKTIPVSTAIVERSFSAMNRILSWARSSLDSTRASDLMTISLNRDIVKAINLDNVLERWMMQKKP